METKKKNGRDASEVFMSKINEVSKRNPTNPMRVVLAEKFSHSKAVQPHNYRLYFDFTRSQYNPTQPYLPKNYNSEHHYTFPTHRVVVRKKSIEVCYLGHKKQWRKILAHSEEDISRRIDELDREMEDRCFSFLKEFIKNNGGKSKFELIRKRKQDWAIHGDEFLDNIPENLIITDTVGKKVYRDKWEMYGANEVKNYISNRALERFSPVISYELRETKELIKSAFAEQAPLRALKSKIKEPIDIIQYPELVKLLSKNEKIELEDWLFEIPTM